MIFIDFLNRGKFTTGEFAKVCGTTKETLFHYDKIGLLKPQVVGDNRYRYYSANQFYRYDLIDTLKIAGCSLAEIREYLNGYDPERYLELLGRCSRKLEQQKLDIERRQKLLANSREGVVTALKTDAGEPYLSWCEEEYTVVTPVRVEDELSDVYSLYQHFSYCGEHQLGDAFQTGSIIRQAEILKKNYQDWGYFSKIDEPAESDRLHIKPAGFYATILHRGCYDTIEQSCEVLLSWIDRQGYTLAGDGYFYDLISYLASQKEDEFVVKISFQVKKNPDAQAGTVADRHEL
ncbi:MAG: MerR family transcriptional regulator [Lachnospiraceae bacterium]